MKNIKGEVEKELSRASTLHDVDKIWRKYLGRKGKLTVRLRSLKELPEEQRKAEGIKLNRLKEELTEIFQTKVTELQEKEYTEQIKKEWIDVTRPGHKKPQGSLHPISKAMREAEDIFGQMGFAVAQGPQIESEWYNFDSLNIPKNHPARDMWDTFWLRSNQSQMSNVKGNRSAKDERLLLRTHTTAMQVRYMEENNPPFRVIFPGRVYRHEATDASHEIQFYQLDGLMVSDNGDINVSNFRAVIGEFLRRFFKTDVKMRLRPSYFPFTEPSFEIDISCVNCNQKGCHTCSHGGWVEMMGAGMVHPKVFSSAKYNPNYVSGFAFGVGIDRLAMIKYGVDDVRLFYSGDIRFLEQFK